MLKGLPRHKLTIYNRINDSYKRTVIDNCVTMEHIEANFKSQGVLPLDAISTYIFNYDGYVKSNVFSGEGWTITVGNEKTNTYIVNGECEFIFNGETIEELSREIREFEKNYQYKRPIAISPNLYGSDNMRHVKIVY